MPWLNNRVFKGVAASFLLLPLACGVQAAQVTVKGESADLVAADRGTATLRLEQPGRCELTLCKQALNLA